MEIRKARHGLIEAGTWVVIFSFWSALKTAGWLFLEHNSIEELMSESVEVDVLSKVVFLVIFFVIVFIDLAIRLRTGMSARSDGLHGRKSGGYLVWTVILMLLSLSSIVSFFIPLFADTVQKEFELAAFLLELSSFAVLLELFICGILVRRSRRAD